MARYDRENEGPLQPRYRGVGPRGYRRSDERIREDVSDRLTDDPHIDATGIGVSVAQGEVTLTGTVRDRAARRHAEDIAEAVSGVTHVQNDLRADAEGGQGKVVGQGSVTGPGAPAQAGMVEALNNSSMVLGKVPLPAGSERGNGDD